MPSIAMILKTEKKNHRCNGGRVHKYPETVKLLASVKRVRTTVQRIHNLETGGRMARL
jgi:hypothetical protein